VRYALPDLGREERQVEVGKTGWVSVNVGEVVALPDAAFETPFRFLSIWHVTVGFIPWKQVASLADIASEIELQLQTQYWGNDSYDSIGLTPRGRHIKNAVPRSLLA